MILDPGTNKVWIVRATKVRQRNDYLAHSLPTEFRSLLCYQTREIGESVDKICRTEKTAIAQCTMARNSGLDAVVIPCTLQWTEEPELEI